jgi:cytochrome c oxidase subunit 2
MRFRMFTVSAADFDSWAAHQKSPAAFGAVAPAAPAAPATATAAATDSTQKNAAQPSAPQAVASVPAATVQQAGFIAFPREKLPAHTIPKTPVPAGLKYNESLRGDPERGRDMLTKGIGACLGCHTVAGNPSMMGVIGPNLTHIGSRSTIAGGLYPNDTKHLALWIKNSRWMKPGVLMPTLGAGEYDPIAKTSVPKSGLTDEQIADIVAYLQALK